MLQVISKRVSLYLATALLGSVALMMPFILKLRNPANGNTGEQKNGATPDISDSTPAASLTPNVETTTEAKPQGWVVGDSDQLRDNVDDMLKRTYNLRRLRGMELEKAIETILGEVHQLAEILEVTPRPATYRFLPFHGATKPKSGFSVSMGTSPDDIIDPKEREEYVRALARNAESRRIKSWLNKAETQYKGIRIHLEWTLIDLKKLNLITPLRLQTIMDSVKVK